MKRIYATALFLALFSYGNAQGTNWTCKTAKGILNFPYVEDVDASASPDDSIVLACTAMNDGVWYTFTGDGKYVSIEVTGKDKTNWDPAIGVYKGSCSALTCAVFKNKPRSQGFNEKLTMLTTAGTVYYINIGNGANANKPEGFFKLKISTEVVQN